MPRFARDLGSGRYARHVQRDVDSAEASGVAGTPTFFVNGRRHTGPFDAGTLATALLSDAGVDAAEPVSGAPVAEVVPPPVDLPPLPADLPETPERGGDHPRLTDAQLARLERVGTRRPVARGDVLYRPGDPGDDFCVVLSSAVAVVGQPRDDEAVVRVHGARRFLGALDLFDDRPVKRTAVVVRSGEVLQLTVGQLRAVLDSDPQLEDVVLRAYLIRGAIGY